MIIVFDVDTRSGPNMAVAFPAYVGDGSRFNEPRAASAQTSLRANKFAAGYLVSVALFTWFVPIDKPHSGLPLCGVPVVHRTHGSSMVIARNEVTKQYG